MNPILGSKAKSKWLPIIWYFEALSYEFIPFILLSLLTTVKLVMPAHSWSFNDAYGQNQATPDPNNSQALGSCVSRAVSVVQAQDPNTGLKIKFMAAGNAWARGWGRPKEMLKMSSEFSEAQTTRYYRAKHWRRDYCIKRKKQGRRGMERAKRREICRRVPWRFWQKND